jgi:hypothetical protein
MLLAIVTVSTAGGLTVHHEDWRKANRPSTVARACFPYGMSSRSAITRAGDAVRLLRSDRNGRWRARALASRRERCAMRTRQPSLRSEPVSMPQLA